MSPGKLSQSNIGEWGIDDYEMPVVSVDPGRCFLRHPPAAHTISTGAFAAIVDATGHVRFVDQSGSTPLALNLPQQSPAGAFHICLSHKDDDRTFLLSNVSSDENPRLEWGVAHVTQTADLTLAEASLEASLTFAAPLQTEFMFVELTLRNLTGIPVEIDVRATAELSLTHQPGLSPAVFKMDHVAMFPETDALKRDFFIAGLNGWVADQCGYSLAVKKTCSVSADRPVRAQFIVGLRSDCTMDWVKEQFSELSLKSIREAHAAPLKLTFPRFPASWMREECVWDVSRLLSGMHGQAVPHGLEPPVRPDPPVVRSSADDADSTAGLRDLLRLSLPLTYVNPELAVNNLTYVTRRLHPQGALGSANEDHFRPAVDACDLEIWLILGWCHVLTITGDTTGTDSLAILDGSEMTLQDILEKAFCWVESAIGTGAHGLIRMGAGDGLQILSESGIHGSGESTTATAQCIYALELWLALEPQLTQRPSAVVQRARHLLGSLKQAVAEAFANGVFIRGYTDAGLAIGDGSQRWFSDAQCWSLLAGCGSAEQSEKAMAALHHLCENSGPVTLLSKPYQLPPPTGKVSRDCPLPGYGENGGVDALNEACVIWALAENNARETALQIWRRFSLRQLMVDNQFVPFLSADARGILPGHLFSSLPCVHALAGNQPAPDTRFLSWKHFALCKALS